MAYMIRLKGDFKMRLVLCGAFLLIFLAFYFDRDVLLWMGQHRVAWLDPFMIFLTDFGMLFGVILFFVLLLELNLSKSLLLVVLSFAAALEASSLIKLIFETPRPVETWGIVPLKIAEGFSFPSMHATFIFAALPFFEGKLRRYWILWFLFALAVAWSRVYVGVHYASDVLAGALLGYGIGAFGVHLEHRYHMTDWLHARIRDEFEVRRQVGHAVIGIAIIFLYQLQLLTPQMLLIVLVVGGALSLASLRWEVPIVHRLLDYFERPHHREQFPGRGSFFMVLGALLSLVFFPENVALAAIAIMALGDSVTNIFGRYFGKIWLPYNRKKTLEGALMGVVAATLGAFFFVPIPVAFVASLAAMFVETLDLKIGVALDDNILVPLVAGAVMVGVM